MRRTLFLPLLLLFVSSGQLLAQTVIRAGKFEPYGGTSKVTAFMNDYSDYHWVAGTFKDSVDVNPETATSVLYGGSPSVHNAFLAHFNTSGYDVSFALGNTTDSVTVHDLYIHSGDVYVVGTYSGTVDFAHTPGSEVYLTATGAQDAFIAKYGSTGSLLFAKSIECNGTVSANTLAFDGSQGILYVGGHFNGVLDGDLDAGSITFTSTATDGFIYKLGSDLSYADTRVYNDAGDQYVREFVMDPYGSLCVMGEFTNTIDLDISGGSTVINSAGGQDVFIVKYDPPGLAYNSSIQLGGTGNEYAKDLAYEDYPYSITALIDYENSINLDPLGSGNVVTSLGGRDVAIARYSNVFSNQVFGKSFGNSGDNRGFCIDKIPFSMFRSSSAMYDSYFAMNFTGTMDFDPSAAVTVNGTATNTAINSSIIALDSLGDYLDHGISEASSINGFFISGTMDVYAAGNFAGSNVDILPFTNSNLLNASLNSGYYLAFNWCHMTGGSAHIVAPYECGTCSAMLACDVTGGYRAPLNYMWSNGDYYTYDQIATGACSDPGPYNFTATDGNGCTYTDTVTVQSHPTGAELDASVSVVNTSCGNNFGSASASAVNAVGSSWFYWSNGATTSSVDSLEAGNYFVQVTDDLMCYSVVNFQVANSDGPIITLDTAINVNCYNSSTGAINVSVSGGTAPYTYLWSNGATTEDISGLAGGTYTLMVTDAAGCTNQLCLTLTQPWYYDIYVDNALAPSFCTNNDGMLYVVATGGASPFTYQWDANALNQTNDTAFFLSAGIYSVTVTDSLGCSITRSFGLSDVGGPSMYIYNAGSPSCTGSIGFIEYDVYGASPFTYEWSTGQTTEDIYNVPSGNYVLAVTDAAGCTSTNYYTLYDILPAEPQVCMVTVDSTNTHNVVVWDKTANPEAEYFKIYREGFCNSIDFGYVGSTDADSLSIFNDTVVNTDTRSWKYYVTAVDTCGNESWPSEVHRTIHLTSVLDANVDAYLQWEPYQGRPVAEYLIYRKQPAGLLFDLIDTVDASVVNYLDTTDFSAFTELEYYVEAVPSTVCSPSRAFNQNSSRSNHTRNVLPMDTSGTGLPSISIENLINVYPNPANNMLTIGMTINGMVMQVAILNHVGQLVKSASISQTTTLSIADLTAGVYYVRVTGNDKLNKTYKVIVTR